MLIVFGQTRCGKVDQVPGLFHVVTEYFHIYYFPFIPLGSYLILEAKQNNPAFRGTRIYMNLKSVLMGWFRALLVVGCIGGLIGGIVVAAEGGKAAELILIPLVLIGGCLGLYWLTRRFERASRERALALAEEVGLPAEFVEECFEPARDSLGQREPDQFTV
jgi:hypothetical protein